MVIAAMSQLLNGASRASDFQIDKIDRTKIPLVKHPESFRKTLVQIANDYYGAFMLAHTNMENIQLQMTQVPGYIRDSIEIIHRRNNTRDQILAYAEGVRQALYRDLLIKLENIKKIANNGLRMSTEVSQAFDKLGKLNRQILLAIMASHGAGERAIADAIQKGLTQLCKLNSNWADFTQNFNSINNYIKEVTRRGLTDFVEDAKSAKEDISIIEFMTNSINKALECSIKTHQTAKMYVEFSNNQIMKSLNVMQRDKNALPSC
jgi:hypothetical protein